MSNKVQLPKEAVEMIIHNYCDNHYGLEKTGKFSGGYSSYIVRRVLLENGIKIRSFSEAAGFSNINRRKYNCKDNYFSIESHNMAYLLGFLAADGTVSKSDNTIKIGLAEIDTDFLENIRKELQCEKPLFHYTTNNGYKVVELNFTSSQMKKDLAKYNIVPRKTYSFNFPENLNKKYWIDFIRGYFDGDGSVSTAGPGALRWQICSYRREVLDTIINFLKEEYDIPKVSIMTQPRGKSILHYFQYSTNATKKIFSILYYPNCLCLPRKYIKYENLLNSFK